MSTARLREEAPPILVVAPSRLGWIALIGAGKTLKQLTFGHASSRAAIRALDPGLRAAAEPGDWNAQLVRRLQDYASGQPVDFRDVRIDTQGLTAFQRRVTAQCRKIAYGEVRTYGRLAALAGSPRAARAVGNCMAANRFPLIVPCHRVLPASGRPGAFSAPGSTAMKQRLLAMEAGRRGTPRR
ncbi:MAG: methylated-DNA--[protein]-cysteine S-methyltransferase [Pirellulales bacterium]|nr:methylated-DNA--[protein]-cysteine S-methyltransferase [Pirellulales bacterium]